MKTSNQRRTEGGKGDLYRRVDKRKFDIGYLRAYGEVCPDCHGRGGFRSDLMTGCDPDIKCGTCDGLGYVEKRKHASRKSKRTDR